MVVVVAAVVVVVVAVAVVAVVVVMVVTVLWWWWWRRGRWALGGVVVRCLSCKHVGREVGVVLGLSVRVALPRSNSLGARLAHAW